MGYVFDASTHFTKAAGDFLCGLVGFHTAHNLLRIRREIANAERTGLFKASTFEQALRDGRQVNLPLSVELSDEVEIAGKQTSTIIKSFRGLSERSLTPGRIDRFEIEEGAVRGKKPGKQDRSAFSHSLGLLAQGCINACFESVGNRLRATYGKEPLSWDPSLQFFRLLRHGVSHGNRFNIRGVRFQGKTVPGIDPGNPPRWRGLVMTDVASLQGQVVFFEFIGMGDLLVFLADVDQKLCSGGIRPS